MRFSVKCGLETTFENADRFYVGYNNKLPYMTMLR